MEKILAGLIALIVLIGCNEQKNKPEKVGFARVTKNTIEENIYRSGDSMLAAYRRKDWLAFVKYNHPNMVKRMGGTEAFASFINLQMKQIPDTAVISIVLGKILQIVKTPKDAQCVVEQNMKMELQGVNIDKTTYLLGESLDNGNSWTFFDASTKTSLKPKDIKPDISSKIKIPEISKQSE